MGYAASYSTYYDIFLFLGYAALLASGSLLQTFLHCVDEISNSSKEVLVSITGSAFVCCRYRYMGIRSVQNADCALQIEGKIQTAES